MFRRFSRCVAICLSLVLLPALQSVTAHADSLGDTAPQPSGSVFTVQRNDNVTSGCADSQPNDQSIDIGIVEFNDDGTFAKVGKLDAALSCITKARRQNPNGAVVVLFIHGWHHSATWNTRTDEGDAHFAAFRRILMSLALREAERYTPQAAGRRVVGVYFGWNGDPKEGVLYRINENLAFLNRYKVAVRIAERPNIRHALASIIDRTKATLESTSTPESPLVMIGHSMGALMLETAFLALLREDGQNLGGTTPGMSSSCAGVESGGLPAKFPDLLLLLNSAADSRVAKDLAAQIERKRIQKLVACGFTPFQAPLVISATSTGDTATRILLPTVKPGHKTAANTSEMLTHQLVREQPGAVCTPKPSGHIMVDYYQSWHCMRQPAIDNGRLTSVAIDLPQAREPRNPCHVRYRLEPIHAGGHGSPHWIFLVPQSVIKDHNDIFNAESNLLIMGLTQVSGAVMSLARDWGDTFESEEGTCALL